MNDRPRYTIILEPEKHVVDPIRALRGALKRLLRSYGLRAISVEEAKPANDGGVMTLNLDAEWIAIDPTKWTALQTEICMSVALAKRNAFIAEAERAAEFVRLGFITRPVAAEYLHEAAIYNQLYFEYGRDAIQRIMSAAFDCEAA
jgi:hypothetical protein